MVVCVGKDKPRVLMASHSPAFLQQHICGSCRVVSLTSTAACAFSCHVSLGFLSLEHYSGLSDIQYSRGLICSMEDNTKWIETVSKIRRLILVSAWLLNSCVAFKPEYYNTMPNSDTSMCLRKAT